MSIDISTDFTEGFEEWIDGTSSVSYLENNKKINIKSPAGSNRALMTYNVPLKAGDEFEFEVFARNVKGKSAVSLDLKTKTGEDIGLPFTTKEVIGNEFKRIVLKTVIPYRLDVSMGRITMGTWERFDENSESEFTLPKLKVNSTVAGLKTISYGVVRIHDGNVTINTRYKHLNFDRGELQTDNETVRIYLAPQFTDTTTKRIFPMVSPSTDNPFPAFAGNVASDGSYFELKLSNGTEFLDLTTGVYYVFYKVMI